MGPWGLALYPFIRAAIGGPAVVGHGKRCRGESTRTFGKMRVRGDEADVRSAEARFRRRIAADTRRLDTGEPGRGEPPGQTARGRRRDRWHGLQLGRGHVGALAVQSDQRVATRSWDCARPTNGSPAVAPRARFLIDPMPRSNVATTSSFSTNSATAVTPDVAVSDWCGKPIDLRCRVAKRDLHC
jgi:hypothetical protein